ncbi:uncharacterized protein LY79DRAFT_573055 [Colletotrichum navitas]|uniref:Uncharacterized protein n=1 Tax=Colletotrichum navitas TaxID=681940 RepID=A0AAD8PJF8_9PEZI|nr:uncharacterized protein LY79DRAFT_573055 [Colletotrichum navitas]KAK1565950.1 hypothetical protein LY79DRAFT_573055 [Colletotrichum navitas]
MPRVCVMVGRVVETMVTSRASMSLLAARAMTIAQKRSPFAGAAATDSLGSIELVPVLFSLGGTEASIVSGAADSVKTPDRAHYVIADTALG